MGHYNRVHLPKVIHHNVLYGTQHGFICPVSIQFLFQTMEISTSVHVTHCFVKVLGGGGGKAPFYKQDRHIYRYMTALSWIVLSGWGSIVLHWTCISKLLFLNNVTRLYFEVSHRNVSQSNPGLPGEITL